MRRLLHSALILGGVMVVWLVQPLPALAHGSLVQTWPPDRCATPAASPSAADCRTGTVLEQAPDRVKLTFTEPVKPIRHGLIVTGPAGKPVEQGAISVNDQEISIAVNATATGTYQVTWRVISQDSHPVRGNYTFSVGQPSTTVQRAAWTGSDVGGVSQLGLVLQVLGRLIHFAGYALGFGPFFFEWLVLPAGASQLKKAAVPRLKRLSYGGLGLLLVAEPVGLLGQSASLSSEQLFNPDVIADILASSFGQVTTERLGAALLLWVFLGVDREGAGLKWGLTGLYMGLALVDGQTSHAVISDTVWLGLPANTVHLAAMGLWVGGLVSLIALWKIPEIEVTGSWLVRRFGRLAGLALGWLIISGLLMAWLRLAGPSPWGWLNTLYGQTLLVKSGLLIIVAAIAWAGWRSVIKKSERWWRLELALLVGILGLAGLLISLPPPA